MNRFLFLAAFPILIASGCQRIDVVGVERAINATVPTSSTGAMAMAAMAGDVAECAEVLAACDDDYPCEGDIEIEVSEDCPFPINDGADGWIQVYGTWESRDRAELGATFADVSVGDGELLVAEMGAVFIDYDIGGTTTVDFASAGIEVSEDFSDWGIDVAAWDVVIDHNDTRGNTHDDLYTINGSGLEVHNLDMRSTALVDVVVDGSCDQNPISGTGTLEEIAGPRSRELTVEFRDVCDGRAEVTANSNGRTGETVLKF